MKKLNSLKVNFKIVDEEFNIEETEKICNWNYKREYYKYEIK